MNISLASLRPHATYLAVLLVLAGLGASYKLSHLGLSPNSDYDSYQATAHVLAGDSAALYPQRLLKPLAPLLIAPFAGSESAFLVEVLAFYLLLVLACYWLGWLYFKERRSAFLLALLVALSYPLLRYGVDLYTETGALAFYALSLALTYRYLEAPSRKLLIVGGLVIGVGLLWKEYSLVNGLAFGLVLLFERVEWRAKAINLALLGLCSLALAVLVQLLVWSTYHYTYLDWYTAGGAAGFATEFTLFNLVKSFAALLGLSWLMVPVGIWSLPELSPSQRKLLYVAIPASLSCLLWGYVSSRLFYVAAIPMLLLAVFGLSRCPAWLTWTVVALTLAANLLWLTISMA